MERTFVMLKPDAVQRGLMGEIITRFERAGLKIIGLKMLEPTRDHYHHHYEKISQLMSRVGEEAYAANLDFMMSGPVVGMAIEGLGAVALVRKLVGGTEPAAAQPGTIRGDYSHMAFTHAHAANTGVPNLIHASGDPKEAAQEIELWFEAGELYSYPVSHQEYTQPTKPFKKAE